MITTFARVLALVGLMNMSFVPLAMAKKTERTPAQSADLAKAKTDLQRALELTEQKGFKFLNSNGAVISVQDLAANPNAIRDGLAVEAEGERIAAKLIGDDPKTGFRLMLSKENSGQAIGSVVTFRPGMSQKEILSKFHDAALSLAITPVNAENSAGKGPLRIPASSSALKTTVCLLATLGAIAGTFVVFGLVAAYSGEVALRTLSGPARAVSVLIVLSSLFLMVVAPIPVGGMIGDKCDNL